MSEQTSNFIDSLALSFSVNEAGELVIPAEAVNEHLAAHGVEIEALKTMQQAVNKATNEIVGSAGKVAVDYLAENADAINVKGEFSVGQQKTSVNVKRSKDVPVAPNDKSKGMRPLYGYVEANTSSGFTETSRKNVRKEIQAYAETKLK